MSEKGTQGPPFDPKDVQSFLVLVCGTILFVVFFLVLIPRATRWGLEPHTADQPLVMSPGWLDATEAPPERGREIPPVDPSQVMEPSAALLERGKALFGPSCSACHGESGRGDGPASAGMRPPPRNLTSPDGWKNGATLTGIFGTLTAGIAGSSMAAFDTLPPKDRMALVHYVRSLGPFDHGKDDPVALKALEEGFRSSGGRVPNRIPLSQAEAALVRESAAVAPFDLGADRLDPAARALARRAVIDPQRAARSLAGVPAWRTDIDLFVRAAVSGAPANGFSADVGTLTAREWNDLHALLSGAVR